MVLQDLGRKLTAALGGLNAAHVDETTVDSVLKEICTALLESDVNVKLVGQLRAKVKAKVMPLLASKASTNIRASLQRTIVDELVALVDPSDSASHSSSTVIWKPKKKTANVIMFVGLQGSGKTTSCTKLAVHYQKRGFKSCLVCADTFRAGAFDQLKQNAAKARIPFYGSYTETDPVVISSQGVEKFKSERFEVIIVDTSGRHRQEVELFNEMKQISASVKPDLTIMVLDGAIGQAAESQSKAFKDAAGFGAIIVTKMDGHARGGGAISAVAATKTPIMFIGVGEHLADLERFEPRPFISKLLGMGDISGLMERVKDAGFDTEKDREKMMKKIAEGGTFTLRDMRDTFTKVSSLGPMSKVASMIPGLGQMMQGAGGSDEDASTHLRKMICISDAMTAKELDSDGKMFETVSPTSDSSGSQSNFAPREPNPRVLRVARGSGTSVDMVEQYLSQHKMYQAMAKRMGKAGLANHMSGAGRGRGGMNPAQMAQMLPPEYRTPEGMRKLQQMAQQARGPGGAPDYNKLMHAMNSMRA